MDTIYWVLLAGGLVLVGLCIPGALYWGKVGWRYERRRYKREGKG